MSASNGYPRKHQLRSEEVQDILSRPPSWIMRWGTAVFLFFFALLFGMAFLIPSPEIVSAAIRVHQLSANHIVAEAIIQQTNFDMIRPGQDVDIKLVARPYEKYGLIRGKVLSVDNHFSDSNGSFTIVMSLPAPDAATGKGFAYADNMLGMADIIVANKRLIQKLSPF
jgi:hypothetical protein